MRLKLLIFDLDGTIADTIYSIRDGVNIAMKKYGLPTKTYEDVRKAIGNGARLLVKRCLPEEKQTDERFVTEVFEVYDKAYGETYANVDGCYAGMSEVMHTLHSRGYKLAVLSNKQDHYTKKIIDLLFPDGIVSLAAGQTELPKKPDPTVPLMIARQLGVQPCECAFIGDSEVDVLTAKNAGMKSVACSWGYRPREILEGADVIIDTPSTLAELFE
jgi:phosphoglycolate phosphatase